MANQILMARLPAPTIAAPVPVAGGSLTVGVTYYYKVVPWRGNASAVGSLSNSVFHFHNGPASNEVAFTPTAGNRSVTITWDNVSGNATHWMVFRTTVSGSYPRTTCCVSRSVNSFTDTNVAVGNQALNFAADITCDIPAIDVNGFWQESTVPANGTVVGAASLSGFTGLTVNAYRDRYIYFYTDKGRFLDIDGVRQKRYARITGNSATILYFDTTLAVLPDVGDAFKVSWKPEDIYNASVSGAWGNISAASYLNAAKPIVQKNNDDNYTINACVYNNLYDVAENFAMFGLSKQNFELGQACRLVSWYNAAFYCRESKMQFNTTTGSAETIQASPSFYGPQDIYGCQISAKYNGSGQQPAYGNEGFQLSAGVETPVLWGDNRISNCTFNGMRAVGAYKITDFSNNLFISNGQASEGSMNTLNGVNCVNATRDAFRLSGAIEYHIYNNDVKGKAPAISAYALDSVDACIVNPSPNFLSKIISDTVWPSAPIDGQLNIQYQLGFTLTDAATGNAVQDAIVEVFDKNGNPIYADILDKAVPNKEIYSRAVWSTATIIRQVRGAIYPKVKVTEWIPGYRTQGRYNVYSTPDFYLAIGEQDAATKGKWGSWVTPTLTIPAMNTTGFIFYPSEVVQTIDPSKVHMAHVYGNFKYLQIDQQVLPSIDGLGAKTINTDETQVSLPTGYTTTNYAPSASIIARRFYSNANGRVPLLDFTAGTVIHTPGGATNANTYTDLRPFTVKITRSGYETVQFVFTPSGLYEKEFNLALKPQIPKFEDDHGNVYDRVDKTNSGSTSLRRKIVKN